MRAAAGTVGAVTTTARDGIVAIVDDDETLRVAIGRLLRSLGLRVQLFASAEEFLLRRPRSDDVACLVVDVRMPGMSGIDLQRALIATGRGVPTIVISGDDAAAARQQAFRAGARAFLPKPLNDAILVAAVRAACNGPSPPARSIP
jgi:FixJ family two-component response regulator